MAKHALLSASSAQRWLNCPPSAKRSATYQDTSSEFARQGTDTHSLCEYHQYKAGDHCQFCKAKAVCRKRAEYNLELARYDFEMPATLDADEIASILTKADELANWVSDVKEYALQQALSGMDYNGFKVVEGRSNRKYVNEEAVAQAAVDAGFDPYEKKVLGITAMTALMGKKKFEEVLGEFIHKPSGKPVLVPLSDKRPAMNTAKDDFKEN